MIVPAYAYRTLDRISSKNVISTRILHPLIVQYYVIIIK